jgi:hypothetical protein
MWLNELRHRILGRHQKAKQARRPRKTKTRLYVEELENRLTPTVFNANSVLLLMQDIHTANTNHASANTINLTGPGPYVLTKMDNTTNGPNGLPVIDSTVASTLTINGNGNAIERNPNGSDFRFFDIASGSHGSLVLENVTLRFGKEVGPGSGPSAEGGAIFNNGTLKLNGDVQILNDQVSTAGGGVNIAAGGGIYCSAGSTLALEGNNFFEGCDAIGGLGLPGKNGGSAFGGAIFDNTTTATSFTSTAGTVIEGCAALGGRGGAGSANQAGGSGGSAAGGGLFINATSSAAEATLTGVTFKIDGVVGGGGGAGGSGGAIGGHGGAGASASGGGVAASGGTVIDNAFLFVEDCEAAGGSGGIGGIGNLVSAGNAGNGGNAFGGGIEASGTTLTLSASPILESNFATGGGGGNGGLAISQVTTGGNGGNSGTGAGGGLYAIATGKVTVTLNGALVSGNTANELRPGGGGTSGASGHGGAGGSYTGAFGGGIFLNQNASLASDIIQANTARAGFQAPGEPSNAGTGVDGGAGGTGGTAGGGGLFVAGGTVKVTSSFIELNQADGTPGGNAGPDAGHAGLGGSGQGGGVDVQGGTVMISQSQIENNTAQGGDGGGVLNSAGAVIVGDGAAAGGAAGGGIYVGGGTVNLTADVIQFNQADAGFDTAGKGPQSHNASGGGLYAVTGTTVTRDAFTTADLLNNTDSNNDGHNNFGSGGPI